MIKFPSLKKTNARCFKVARAIKGLGLIVNTACFSLFGDAGRNTDLTLSVYD